MRKIKKQCFMGTFLLFSLLSLTACGANTDSQKVATKAENTKKTVVVATAGAPKPFTYVNKAGELEGYDIELTKAIFKELPAYELSFEKTEFSSVLAGLDTDRYQIGANNFAQNKERQEKYIYSDPIFKNQYVIAVAETNTTISDFADLKGKSTEVSPGLNYATALENYNKENANNEVKLTYSEDELVNVLRRVEDGKFDFQLIDAAMLKQLQKEFGLKLKTIALSEADGKRIGTPYSYLLLSKTEQGETLAADLNRALKKVIASGKATEISEKYFAGDFAPKSE